MSAARTAIQTKRTWMLTQTTCMYMHVYLYNIDTYRQTNIHTYVHTYLLAYLHSYVATNLHTYIHPSIHPGIHPGMHAFRLQPTVVPPSQGGCGTGRSVEPGVLSGTFLRRRASSRGTRDCACGERTCLKFAGKTTSKPARSVLPTSVACSVMDALVRRST